MAEILGVRVSPPFALGYPPSGFTETSVASSISASVVSFSGRGRCRLLSRSNSGRTQVAPREICWALGETSELACLLLAGTLRVCLFKAFPLRLRRRAAAGATVRAMSSRVDSISGGSDWLRRGRGGGASLRRLIRGSSSLVSSSSLFVERNDSGGPPAQVSVCSSVLGGKVRDFFIFRLGIAATRLGGR